MLNTLFSARHYRAIAGTIAELPENERAQVIALFARTFSADNAKFKPALFARACQLEAVNGTDPRD